MTIQSKGSGTRRQLGTSTLGVIGGLLILLMLSAVACDGEPQPAASPEFTHTLTLTSTHTPTSSPDPIPTSTPPASPMAPSSTPSPTNEDAPSILQAAMEAMKEVDSFHFEASADYQGEGVGDISVLFNGEFESPDRMHKRAVFRHSTPQLDPYHVEAIGIGDASYLTDPATGKWMPAKGHHGSEALEWTLNVLQRQPTAFLESVAASLGPEATANITTVDGIDVYHIVSGKSEVRRGRRITTTHVEVRVGVEDSLVREFRKDVHVHQAPCPSGSGDATPEPCEAIEILPSSESTSLRFTNFGKEVRILAPSVEEVEPIEGPLGPMALYESVLVPFSVQYPADWKRRLITLDPTTVHFQPDGSTNATLLIWTLFFDEVSLQERHGQCFGDVVHQRWASICKSVEGFISALAAGEATAGRYIDDWESQLTQRWPLPRAPINALELVSRRTTAINGGASGDIQEYQFGPTKAPRSDVLHRLTHLYKLPGPHPRCHREAQACHVVVHVGYTGTTE